MWKKLDLFMLITQWFDSTARNDELLSTRSQGFDWRRFLPTVAMHLMCLGVFWVGWSWTALVMALVMYAVRMFAITGFYHRYFSHRSFKTSRWCQFAFAVLGAAAAQRGPLWWAGHHRLHHRHPDTNQDVHSPKHHGFLWSHMGWFTSEANYVTPLKAVPDLAKFPEIRFLDRFDILVPILLACALYYLGVAFETFAPELGTNGMQMLIWGFFVSTVTLYHGTYTINSLAHQFGSQRYVTHDESRNNFLLALITFGEGWHNNHHHYPRSPRQGFYWWEIDLTYYGLVVLSWLGLVWDLRPVPNHVKDAKRISKVGFPCTDQLKHSRKLSGIGM